MKQPMLGCFLLLCGLLAAAAADAQESPEHFIADTGATRVLELVFPPGTPFAQAPVLKWDHAPSTLILIEDNVSQELRGQIESELDDLKARLLLKSLQIEQIPEQLARLPAEVDTSDIVIIVGWRAVDSAFHNYHSILRSAVQSDDEAEQVALLAMMRKEPAIQRFRVPFDTGKLQRVVAMVQVGGKVADPRPLVSSILFSSLCPSIGVHSHDQRIFRHGARGAEITDEGYRYLKFLYSDFVPLGITREKLAKKMGATL